MLRWVIVARSKAAGLGSTLCQTFGQESFRFDPDQGAKAVRAGAGRHRLSRCIDQLVEALDRTRKTEFQRRTRSGVGLILANGLTKLFC